MRRITTFSNPFYTQKFQLDGAAYLFTFKWNNASDTWNFDLQDADGNFIVMGVKVVCNRLLLDRYHHLSNCPPGDLICFTNNPSNDSPPKLAELAKGARCEIMYLTLANTIALNASTSPIPLPND